MDRLKKQIKDFADLLPVILANIRPYLKQKRDSGENIEYVTFGVTLIEYILVQQFPVFTHIEAYRALVEEIKDKGLLPEFLKTEVKEFVLRAKPTFGTLITKLDERFDISTKYPEFFTNLNILNEKRIGAVHHLISTYNGKIQKINDELSHYVSQNPIEIILDQLSDIQGSAVAEQEKFYNEELPRLRQ